jgi:hypothetical protein
MSFSPFNRALLQGLLAGAVVLTATACSRSDRTESGSSSSSTVLPDSSGDAVQPSDTGAAAATVTDTAVAPAESSTRPGTAQPNTPRAETATPSDSAAGYGPMERDTVSVPDQRLDSARVTADTADAMQQPSDSSVSGVPSTTDTASVETAVAPNVGAPVVAGAAVGVAATSGDPASGSVAAENRSAAEMVRDTSTIADQTDTVAVSDTAGTLQAGVDTSDYTEAPDSGRAGAVVAAGAAGAAVGAAAGRDNDADNNGGRVRSAEEASEDSSEIPAYETADEEIVNPADQETVAASETRTDEVGAAAVASDVTGAEAVALVSREGVRCAVVDPEENEAVRWDMSSTPVTLNPCGLGSMNLSKIATASQRDSGTAGQQE